MSRILRSPEDLAEAGLVSPQDMEALRPVLARYALSLTPDMAELIDPAPNAHVYDPACGSAGLLIKARLVYEQRRPGDARSPKL